MPTGKMPTRKNAHREKCPQGKMPRRKNAHREKCPTRKNAHMYNSFKIVTVMSAFVKNRAMRKGILRSQNILVDFEKANMNAALLAFPEAEIKGCYFHLCQSLVMKI